MADVGIDSQAKVLQLEFQEHVTLYTAGQYHSLPTIQTSLWQDNLCVLNNLPGKEGNYSVTH